MKEILEALATLQGWFFDYGRNDFHNLIDDAGTNVFLLLDPVKLKNNYNDSGSIESITYSGSFMLLKSSDIDEESYNFRYENYIKPLHENELDLINNELICEQEAEILEWNETEVINVIDENLDGIIVSYIVKINS